MAEPQQQPAKPANPEFLLDDSDLLSPEEQAALDAEQTGEPEPEPEGLPAKARPQQPAPQQADAEQKPTPKGAEDTPYSRVKELSKKNKELEEALQSERLRLARLDERAQVAREAEERARQQPQKPVEVPSKLGARPDAAIDPIGADLYDVRRENEILAYRLEQNERGVGQTAQQVEQTRQQQEFANWVNNDASTYRAQHPDYDAATAHAYAWRVKHWQQRLGLPEQNARAIVDQEAVATAQIARQNGKSAAQAFYELAQETGYNSMTVPATATVDGVKRPEVEVAGQGARERMEQVRKGQKFQGLGRVPSESPANIDWSNMDAQTLADMPEDEFLERINDPVQGPQLRKALQRLEMGA